MKQDTSVVVMYCKKCYAVCLETSCSEVHHMETSYFFDGKGYQFIDEDCVGVDTVSECCHKCAEPVTSVSVSAAVAKMLVDFYMSMQRSVPILPMHIDWKSNDTFTKVSEVKKAIAHFALS